MSAGNNTTKQPPNSPPAICNHLLRMNKEEVEEAATLAMNVHTILFAVQSTIDADSKNTTSSTPASNLVYIAPFLHRDYEDLAMIVDNDKGNLLEYIDLVTQYGNELFKLIEVNSGNFGAGKRRLSQHVTDLGTDLVTRSRIQEVIPCIKVRHAFFKKRVKSLPPTTQ